MSAYEIRLASTLRNAGLRCEVLFPAGKGYNPSLADWRALIRSGLPFVKVGALRNGIRTMGVSQCRRFSPRKALTGSLPRLQ